MFMWWKELYKTTLLIHHLDQKEKMKTGGYIHSKLQ